MASVEKKEILINGAISTIPAFLIGGPAGSISVALLTALLAHNQQQKEDEIRERQRRNDEAYRRQMLERIEKNDEINDAIKELMDGAIEFNFWKKYFETDKEPLHRVRKGCVEPATLYISNAVDAYYNKKAECIKIRVKIYNNEDFLRMLRQDLTKEIVKYDLRSFKRLSSGTIHISYAYSIGDEFRVCSPFL